MQLTPNEATQKYLHGIRWPAMKENVIRAMEQNGAPAEVIDAVHAYRYDRLVGPGAIDKALWNAASDYNRRR